MKTRILLVTALLAASACKKESPTAPAVPATPTAPAARTAPAPAAAPAAGGLAARYAGKEITLAELDKGLATQLFELRSEALEKKILKDLVETEAKKQGKTEQQLLEGVMAAANAKPSDADVKKFFDDNQARMQGRKFDEVKALIEQQLGQQKQRAIIDQFLGGLKKAAGVQILLPAPRVEVKADGPAKGPANAPITIVEFSDFECPFCSRGKETVDRVVAAYPGKIRLVFRDYPLPFHKKAQKASEAAHCANEQGKFWEMHDKLFGDQSKLEVPSLKEHAKALALDAAKFDQCLDSGKHAPTVKANLDAGQAAGVNGTPAFFINGRLLSGAQPFEKFKEIIDAELAAK